jgi:hypothetical protein
MNNTGKVITFFTILCLLALFSALSRVDAAETETAAPLLCAFTKSTVCDSEGCAPVDLEALDLPPFFKVDFKDKLITGVEAMGDRTARKKTQIKTIQRMDNNIILQGIELRAWSILISETTGKMTLTASDDEEAGVFFGVCTRM